MSFPLTSRAPAGRGAAPDRPRPEPAAGGPYTGHLAALAAAWRPLPDRPEETPESTLHALWLASMGAWGTVIDDADDLPPLSPEETERLAGLVAGRLSGVPLAYLTGRQTFLGLELSAGPEAMIPRVETELLATVALDELRAIVQERGGARVIDLCTGSGNIALSLARYLPECEVLGTDVSGCAVHLARKNATLHGLEARVSFREGDLFEPLREAGSWGPADLITCNPPYISSAKVPTLADEISRFEPHAAFDGGKFGMDVLLRLAAQAPRFLAPGGTLCFEVGAGQGEFLATRMERTGLYGPVQGYRRGGEVRVLKARSLGAAT